MGVYFGDTEITNIDNLAPAQGQDITRAFFGSIEVFTVWGEYDDTLPAQYSANGDYLADYRIYGAAGSVGDRTENLVGGFTSTVYGDLIITARRDGTLLLNGKNSQGTTFFSTKITLLEGLYAMNNFLEIDNPGAQTIIADIRAGSSTGSVIDDNKAIDSGAGVKFNVSSAEAGELFYIIRVAQNYMCDNVIIAPTLIRGITIPITHAPYGYEVDMAVSSENLCYKEITGVNIDSTVKIAADSQYNTCIFECAQGETYTIKSEDIAIVYAFFDSEPTTGSSPYNNARVIVSGNTVSFTAPITGWCATRYIATNTPAMAVRGSVVPEKYQPYSKTVTPIYIGSDPLGEDEYISYSEQKIYRMSGVVLTPTDPPVPLPALPTVDGTTITDYAGQSAAVPSRFVAKYREEGF